MTHPDPTELAELALGQLPSDHRATVLAHLSGCKRCASEAAALRRVVDAARSSSLDDLPVPPPDRVWASIAAELGFDDRSAATPGEPVTAQEPPAVEDSARTPRALARRIAVLLAAGCLAVGVLLGSSATWWQMRDGGPTGEGAPLAPVSAAAAKGVVRFDRSPHARDRIHVEVSGLPRTRGYFEVWLMDATRTQLIPVGVLGPQGSATLPLPDRVDLSHYPLVDVSHQHYNGDPAHSGTSVVRGPLKP
ncbi:anti-sigma factor [Streptomyces sp. TRM66268-LWL]|uniref:Anti-sigma factor n=1 Tax=Streptomyces polyasparticus TaxID=2767826 RepID=A0ABR7SIW7_9ACTN|nr:anti-sigma factor [Streptomyces polyasparticus]MBC9715204.1 anti-sigma factor [Streptomyces polyasparticus]